MTKHLLGLIVLGSAVLLSAPAHAFGQAVYGSITGNVVDSNGAAVSSAKVTITDTGKGVNYSTSTNESGNYSQTHLIVGVYEVRVEMAGFTTYVQRNVHVEVDATTQIDVKLTIGNVGEVVNVTSEAPLLKTERSDVSDTITGGRSRVTGLRARP
jgi:carboxypeptidase family protein